jgi:hypothetical protein
MREICAADVRPESGSGNGLVTVRGNSGDRRELSN